MASDALFASFECEFCGEVIRYRKVDWVTEDDMRRLHDQDAHRVYEGLDKP